MKMAPPARETDPLLDERERTPPSSSSSLSSRYVVGALSLSSLFLIAIAGVVGGHVSTTGVKMKRSSSVANNTHEAMRSEWADRSAAWANRMTCTSCAVIFPSPILWGKGFGSDIDAHDCVVRMLLLLLLLLLLHSLIYLFIHSFYHTFFFFFPSPPRQSGYGSVLDWRAHLSLRPNE